MASDKIHIVFVGAGIVSLVSIFRLLEYLTRQGQQDRYQLTVIEQGSEAGCGITSGNGGNITPIEGLPAYRPSPALPALDSDETLTASKLLVKIGTYSLMQMQAFFGTHPYASEQSFFQYSTATERQFPCIYATQADRARHEQLLSTLNISTTPLSDIGKYQTVGIEGGCLHPQNFARILTSLLTDRGVSFQYNLTASTPLYKRDQRHINGLLVTTSDGSSSQILPADKIIVSTGSSLPFAMPLTLYPVGGCTITLPIPPSLPEHPVHPFKYLTGKGCIVFSPHLVPGTSRPSHLRLGGLSWYDPKMQDDTNSHEASETIQTLLTALESLYPELYAATIPHGLYQPWVGFRPYSPDYLPIIGEVIPDSGLWINMGHGPGGTSYCFGAADILWAQCFQDFSPSIPEAWIRMVSPARFQKTS